MNVWTFGCWNSYRSLPWLTSFQKKYPGVQIIGVHSPEFDHERNREKLKSTMSKYNANFPQLLVIRAFAYFENSVSSVPLWLIITLTCYDSLLAPTK